MIKIKIILNLILIELKAYYVLGDEMSKKYIYMLFIFLFFIVSTSIFSFNYFSIEQVKDVYSSDDLKCKYTISNIKEENEKYNILIYYPVTEKNALNVEIMENINIYIEKFKNSLSEKTNDLTIKFNHYESEKYTSFVFDVVINSNESHETKYIFACNYDNDKNKIVTIDDLLQISNDSLNKISNAIFNNLKEQENIKNSVNEKAIKDYLDLDKEKYKCFYFTSDSVIFCFNIDTIAPRSVGIVTATISYEYIT